MDDRDDAVLGDWWLIVRRIVVVVGVLGFFVIVGAFVARQGSTEPAAQSGGALASDSTAGSTVDGAGLNDTTIGVARSAGVAAVATTPAVVHAGLISRRDLIASFATADFAPRLADQTSKQVTDLLHQLGERGSDVSALMLTEQPITATARAVGEDVEVQVWSVMVIAAPGAGPARQVWRTVALRMVRNGARWLVDDWESSLGPTPSPAPDAIFEDATVLLDPLGWEPAIADGERAS